MRDFRDAKAMAHALRDALKSRAVETTHSESLELIANAFGYDNWNILAAKIEAARPRAIEPETSTAAAHSPEPPKTLYCSFCRKSQHEVRKLIAGPSVYVCDECVDLCADIMRDGVLWAIVRRLRSTDESGSSYQAALEDVRTWSTEDVASYVKEGKAVLSDRRRNIQFIERRLALREGEVPQEDATATEFFARVTIKTKEDLVALRKTIERETMRYEDALRIGTTVLAERGQERGG